MSKPAFLTQISTDPFVPSWLDELDLQKLLAEQLPEYRRVSTSSSSRAQYFAQAALRVQLQLETVGGSKRTLNYLIKSAELANTAELKFPIGNNFQTESYMYNVVLPAIEQLYEAAGQSLQFSPRSYKLKTAEWQQANCLYLDYLQAKGYRAANQSIGLDKLSMQVLLAKLAAFHAGTARFVQLRPEQPKQLPRLLSKQRSADAAAEWKVLLQRGFHESLRANSLWQYEDKVKHFQQHVAEATAELSQHGSFNVIVNGACWPNNLLCQADAFGQWKDAVFVDFHAAKYGPAVHDLFNILLTAPRAADRLQNFDAYVKYYHEQLIANLNLLNYNGNLPKLTDFQLDLLKFGHWGFEVITEILPIMLSDVQNVEMDQLFRAPAYAAQVKDLLPWLENRAYFGDL